MFRSTMTLSSVQRAITFAMSGVVALAITVSYLHGGPGPVRFVGALVGAVMVGAWAMAPCGLEVEGGELRILRRAWPARRVALKEVVSASPLTSLGGGTIRLFGVGGFFGSYGLFRSSGLGRFHLYATRSGTAVLVRLKDASPLVLTPDDVDGTIAAIDPRPSV